MSVTYEVSSPVNSSRVWTCQTLEVTISSLPHLALAALQSWNTPAELCKPGGSPIPDGCYCHVTALALSVKAVSDRGWDLFLTLYLLQLHLLTSSILCEGRAGQKLYTVADAASSFLPVKPAVNAADSLPAHDLRSLVF